jgi:PAS domain S-box-containing protein
VVQVFAGEDLKLLEQLEAGVVLVDPGGTVVLWNADATRILGLGAEEAIGRKWTACVTPVHGSETGGYEAGEDAIRAGIVRQGGNWHGVMQVRTSAGKAIWVRAHIRRVELPAFAGETGIAVVVWAADDPERTVVERDAALPYRDLFRHSPEALFLLDAEATIVDVNDAAAAMLEVAPQQILGLPLSRFVDDWTGRDHPAAMAAMRSAGSLIESITATSQSGRTFPAEIMAWPVSQAHATYVLGRIRDTTAENLVVSMMRDLGALARTNEDDFDVSTIAGKAVDIVAAGWRADAAFAVLSDSGGFSFVAGTGRSAAIIATLGGMDPGQSPLVRDLGSVTAPSELDLNSKTAPAWAKRAATLGLHTLFATPLVHDDREIGAMVLLWSGAAAVPFDAVGLSQMGRHVGLIIGSTQMRSNFTREANLRATLQESARIGGVVVAQMSDSVLTTDAGDCITGLNPAGENLYGFSAAEVVDRRLGEVVEQLGLDGAPMPLASTADVGTVGYYHGRAVHRPLIGIQAGRPIVVDLSVTAFRDEQHKPAGMIYISREIGAAAHLETEAAALSSLAVATGRARSRREVAEAALERLCEATMADVGLILCWGVGGHELVASRGLPEELLALVREVDVPEFRAALEEPGQILDVVRLNQYLEGTDLAKVLATQGLATGFLVGLRSRDELIGYMALAARHPGWGQPSDEVILQAAAQVVGALDNARLMERLEAGLGQEQRLTAQIKTLVGLTLLPDGDIDQDRVAQFLLDKIVAALGADGGFAVRENHDNSLEVVASSGISEPIGTETQMLPPEAFPFWQRLSEQPSAAAFHEKLADLPAGRHADLMSRSGVASYAVFPVREGDRLGGAFVCHFAAAGGAASTADDRTIDAVGRIIAIAYANVRMSAGINEAAEHERRLTAELRALQELTLLGASTDDLARLAQETIEAVVVATGAAGGGYILVDPVNAKVDPIVWVGQSSRSWTAVTEPPAIPPDWPSLDRLGSDEGIWLSRADTSDAAAQDGPASGGAQAVLPLRVDDRLAGVLHLEWSVSPRVEQFDDHFLEPIARICSISLANFRLRSELLHRAAAQRALNHRLDTLDELTRIGEQASSFEELAHRTVSLVREALGAAGVCYLLIEPGHHFETHAVAGETGAFRLWLKGVPAKEAPGGGALISGGGSVLGDFVAGQVNDRVLPLARSTGFRSFGAIPIRTGEELAGALLCFFEQPAAAIPVDETALDSVARIGGIALANFRLRERLVSSEERYRTLFEESPDAFLVTALDGTVLDANEAAVRLYHINRGEVLGRYFGQLISADEREMARRRQIVWAQGRGTFQDRGRRPDGSEFPVEVELRVVELGGQRRFLSLVRDLSDQERLTNELLQAQKMEAIGQLVSGVAHELNNPLAAIVGFSQLMNTDDRLPEDMKHNAGLMVHEANRTRRIVQGLLDFARQRPPERRQTSIATLVKSVLELQSYAVLANRIEVVLDIPESLPEVDLDRAQLQQVLLNLTINAIQAIRSRDRSTQAHLWVSAAVAKNHPGPLGAKADKGNEDSRRVRITIRDDGPGVPESARARLFDPFFTTKQPGEGTGLGLSVSFGIVAAHGGLLWYEPGPANVGSCFMIELPVRAKSPDERPGIVQAAAETDEAPFRLAPAAPVDGPPARKSAASRRTAAAAAASAAASAAEAGEAGPSDGASSAAAGHAGATKPPEPAPGSGDRPRILALDDEPSIRAFLKKALTNAGMDCDVFQDGSWAMEGLRDASYAVMLIDHRMAGMSGTEFYEAAVDFRPELARRAVFMSGDVLNPDLRGFATQRGIRLLAKPFDIDAVIRVVREALAAADEADRLAN